MKLVYNYNIQYGIVKPGSTADLPNIVEAESLEDAMKKIKEYLKQEKIKATISDNVWRVNP